ncbi:MAG: O-antigen ligase family protein, partial [Candidatus Omnitrophota bacterium]
LKTLKNVLIALIAGTAIVCIDGIAQYIIGKDLFCRHPLMHDVGLNRMTATYRHCNDLGVYLVTVVGVIGTLALYKLKGIKRWGALAVALLIIICIALTFSRGAALGLCGAALIIGIVRRDKLILGLMGAGLVALPFVMPGSVKAWAGSTHSFLEFFCNLDRLSFYRSAIEMIKAHPFVGVGINTFSRVYVNYKVPDVGIITPTTCYAHNNFLQMGAEIGLIGLGIFLVIITVFFFRMGKAYAQKERPEIVRIVALGVICAVAAFLLNGLTESSFYFSKLVVLLWFMMGLGSSLIFLKE